MKDIVVVRDTERDLIRIQGNPTREIVSVQPAIILDVAKNWADIQGKPSVFTPDSHTHDYLSQQSADLRYEQLGGGGIAYTLDWTHSTNITSLILPFLQDGFYKLQGRIVSNATNYHHWCLQTSSDGTNFYDNDWTGGVFNAGNPGVQFGAFTYASLHDPWSQSHPDFKFDGEFAVKDGLMSIFISSISRSGGGLPIMGVATCINRTISHLRVIERNSGISLLSGSYVKLWRIG